MFACGGLELYFHGQEGLAAIFSPFAAILEKFIFFVLGPLVGPLCTVSNPSILYLVSYYSQTRQKTTSLCVQPGANHSQVQVFAAATPSPDTQQTKTTTGKGGWGRDRRPTFEIYYTKLNPP